MGLRVERLRHRAGKAGAATVLVLAALALCALAPRSNAEALQDSGAKDEPTKKVEPKKGPQAKLGLALNKPGAYQGYTLLAPMMSKKTYLIDLQGRVVRTWQSESTPALSAYLLENGNLLRAGTLGGKKGFGPPGSGGRIQEYNWDGKLVWDYKYVSDKLTPHHDITKLPNGNVLMVVAEKKTAKEAIAAGRSKSSVGDHLMMDALIEVKPTGSTTGEVVWEWHLCDHLIQDHDSTKANYGKVADHPELVDINYSKDAIAPILAKKGGDEKLKSIGYVGGGKKGRFGADWTHVNAVAYNAKLDQIMLSVHGFSELWVIDHSTTKTEAAGHKGGKSGKGGDLLYRWGNPRAYRAGTAKDQQLFAQHNAHWIPKGHPGEGHILVFNNGMGRRDGSYSSVDEIVPPVDSKGQYALKPGSAYGPEKAVWSYTAPKKSDFFSMVISGADRLPNGNTLICSGVNGTVFEVTPAKEMVWKYVNPAKAEGGFGGFGPPGGGFPGFGPPPEGVQLLPRPLLESMKLTAKQKTQFEDLRKNVNSKLNKVLSDEQKKQLKPAGPGRGGMGSQPQPGQIMTPTTQAKLKLTGEQKTQVTQLQKTTDETLATLLTDGQKKQLKEAREAFARGGPMRFGPGGGGGFPGFGPGGGGFPGFGAPGGTSLFRSPRYGPTYAGLVGKDLTPGQTIEELERKEPARK